MPSWGIHLATANEILKKIDVKDKNAFIIGNFLPDAEKHVIKDFSFFTLYDISHFAELQEINGSSERLPNPIKFYEKYREKINNPLIIGYLTHLLTDYYWNEITDSRYTVRNEKGDVIAMKLNSGSIVDANKEDRRKMKHNDFSLFEDEIIKINRFKIPTYEEILVEYASDIEETKHNKEDLERIVNYLNDKVNNINEEITGEYKLYTSQQMKSDLDNSIEFIINFLKNNNIVC